MPYLERRRDFSRTLLEGGRAIEQRHICPSQLWSCVTLHLIQGLRCVPDEDLGLHLVLL
jgi:hypothetical protein